MVVIGKASNGATDDVEMGGDAGLEENGGEGESGGLDQIEPDVQETPMFIDYLKSSIIELAIGEGEEQTILHAHQGLLVQSPFLANLITNSDSSSSPRRITLNEDVPATASLLEYLYKKDYFPTLNTPSALEHDPSIPSADDTGIALLRHARIYTLAKKLGLPGLSALAHRKIHLVESTARGEIAYARYVYAHTTAEDRDIRRPVAQFWATRSHVLRHEAEHDFRDTCLNFPQFGFDVLSMVLDAQERRSAKLEPSSGSTGPGSARKRARMSQV